MEESGIIYSKNLGEDLFDFFFEALEELKDREVIYVGLSGGRSFNEFYEKLVEYKDKIDLWSKITFCFVDERIVPLDSDDSNYKLVNSVLFEELITSGLITSNQIITLDYNAKDVALDYNLRVPRIDIALFGSGEDGHIASLFPKHELLVSKEEKFLEIHDSPKPPQSRITLSPSMIYSIEFSCIVFKGEGKKEAFEKFINPLVDYTLCPAKLVLHSKKNRVFRN